MEIADSSRLTPVATAYDRDQVPWVSAAPTPRVTQSPALLLGITLMLLVALAALVGPYLARFAPDAVSAGAPLAAPNAAHWFGTDDLGRDLFSRVMHGLRASLLISLAATLLATLPGILLGLVGGYFQGWPERLLSRAVDVLLSLPGLLLAIVLVARLGPSVQTTILALGITAIPKFYRITRSETRLMAQQPFVEAARSVGGHGLFILLRHIFPNIGATLLVLVSMQVGIFLLMSSGLSFIGLGVQPPDAELGALLASGRSYFLQAWWMAAFPGAAILLAALGFNLSGEGLRDRIG